jgi:hypothetical protein
VIDAPLEHGSVVIRGAVRIERTERGILPRRYAEQASRRIVDEFMRASLTQSAGVRLAFRTEARRIELRVLATKLTDSVDGPLPYAHYDLCADAGVVSSVSSNSGARRLFSFLEPLSGIVDGDEVVLSFELDGSNREYELWLPYTDEVELRGLRADAALHRPTDGPSTRWVHHGSSISHGYLASRTTNTWPVRVAQQVGLDLTNLSYSGNALLDQSTARTIRDTPADVISVKLGINVVNGDMMRLRVFRSAVHGFLDTIRDGHPHTPLLVVSPVCCPPVEALPGPTVFDTESETEWVTTAGTAAELETGKLSLGVIRTELERIVADRCGEDPHLGYLDGSLLYGLGDNARMPLPDNLHPGDEVNALIAERFAQFAFGEQGWLRPAPEQRQVFNLRTAGE